MVELTPLQIEKFGYDHPHRLPTGEWAALRTFLYTVGLCVGLGELGYRTRFCYPDARTALFALLTWDGLGDPPGPWIKEKGGIERHNPATFKGIPISEQSRTTQRINVNITKDLLRSWSACADGYSYFIKNWPDGSTYVTVQAKLREDQKGDWSAWLTNCIWNAAIADPASIAALAQSEVDEAIAATKNSPNFASGNYSTAASSGNYSTAASSGNYSTAASSGYYSKAASSGYSSTAASSGYSSTAASSGDSSKAASSGNYSTVASSGNYSTAASSGNYSKAASSGNYSKAASSGDSSTAASSGNYSKAASSGNYSKAASSGKETIAMVAGLHGQAKAGTNGCIALCWHDGKRNRIVVGYVGEDGIEADTFYRVADGKLVRVE